MVFILEKNHVDLPILNKQLYNLIMEINIMAEAFIELELKIQEAEASK